MSDDHTGDGNIDEEIAAIRELVFQHPASTAEELADVATEKGLDPGDVPDLLRRALANELVVTANEKYWVMRTGEYAFEKREYGGSKND